MRSALLVTTLFLTLAACHKSDNGPSFDAGAGDGFSHRDASGMTNGAQDPTDWTADATWNEQEKALFSELSISLDGPARAGFFDYLYAYPNPSSRATWVLQSRNATGSTPSTYTVAAVLVRRDYQVVQRLAHNYVSTGYSAVSFDYAQLGLSPGELSRLYYVVFNNNGLICKGHGDLRYDK